MRRSWLSLPLLVPLAACNASVEDRADQAMAAIERTEPTFALLREHEPQAYAELRALLERAVADGRSPEEAQLVQRGRAVIVRAVSRRIQQAPDEVTMRFAAFVADQARSLDSNPQVCRDLLMGTAGDVRPYLDAAMQEREKEMIGALLTSAPGPARAVASQEEVEAFVTRLVVDAPSALGLDAQQVQVALDGAGSPQNVCRVNQLVFRRISEMPPAQGAAIFRLIQQLAAQQMPSA